MQIKRHWLLVETMPFGYFFSGVDTRASRSNQAEQQEPRAAPPDLCRCAENAKQPEFSVEPEGIGVTMKW